MANAEIKSLFRLPSGRYLPCGLNIWHQLWWRFVPGVVVNVKWPKGWVVTVKASKGFRFGSVVANDSAVLLAA